MFARISMAAFLLSSVFFSSVGFTQRMTPEEIQKYDPPGRPILDGTEQATFTQNFILRNTRFLVPLPEFESTLQRVPRAQAESLRQERIQINREALSLLQRLRGTISATESDLFAVCEERPDNLIAALVKKVEDDRQDEECRNIPLPVGGVASFPHRGRLQIPAYHVLKRLTENRYQATLNLDIRDGVDPHGARNMLAKIRGCMDIAAPYLKGPDGKMLEIRIVTPNEAFALPAEEQPQPYRITVSHEDIRGNAATYTPRFQCDTITHEILHLLGLCDEYLESWEFSAEWSCRIVPSDNSVMATHTRHFNNVVPRATSCRCTSEVCQGTFRLPPQLIEEYSQMENPCNMINGQLIDVKYGAGQTSGLRDGVITFVNNPQKRSLLTDVHFNKIISGYCAREAPGYHQCSQYSQISREDPRCRDIPEECNDPAYFRGVVY